ncbi:hypothetical protein WJX81_000952 [Elliptochloris bilobata]|uniref:GST N-terminal domain-containing protein n=1 Tax=Elliptochloris bilobata TaxID=381761 RepID=A0AAW1QNH9_9CHLO
MSTSAQAGQEAPTKEKFTLQSKGGGTYKVSPGETLNVATAGVHAFVRLGSGAFVSAKLSEFRKRPDKPIILYEFDGCPFCRKVREATSLLDIDVLFYPCPKNGPTWRPKAIAMSGKQQFPFMVDPNNNNWELLESNAIISYLYNEYGDGNVPLSLRLGPLTALSIGLGLAPRLGRGTQYRQSKLPDNPLDIWGYEASPFVKLAREVLVELELPHVYHSVARNSPKRVAMREKWDTFQVPYLEDSNTGLAMFESTAIIKYLEDTYGVK